MNFLKDHVISFDRRFFFVVVVYFLLRIIIINTKFRKRSIIKSCLLDLLITLF